MSLELLPLALSEFKDRVERWERMGIQLQRLPFSFHEVLPMLVESQFVIEVEL